MPRLSRPLAAPSAAHATGPSIRDVGRDDLRRRRRAQAGKTRTMRAWALLVPERGVPLNFERFPFQEEWYSEEVANAAEVVWMKSAQVGMSTYAWRWGARRAEQFSDSVIYFFPTDDDVIAFGDQRIDPSIENSDLLVRAIRKNAVRTKSRKMLGSGWLALRGTQSKKSVQSVDADAIVFDEYDYSHQGNIAQAERRISGAKQAGRHPRIRRLGYPTLAGYGIHAVYERSDKRLWHVTCPECGHEQPISFQENVRWRTDEDGEVQSWGHDEFDDPRAVADVWRACRECDASLERTGDDPGPIATGRWIATAESDLIGFHVSRLIAPETDLVQIVRASRQTSPLEQEAFWNNDLGLPFSPSEAALTPEDISAAASIGIEPNSRPLSRGIYLGGLDVASARRLSLWVDELLPNGTTRCVAASEPADFEEALEIFEHWHVNLAVVDSMPDRRYGNALANAMPGRVILSSYDYRNTADAFKYNADKNLVTVNRTEAIDSFQDAIRHQRRALPKKLPPKFQGQLLAPKRRTVLDARQNPTREYVSTGSEGDDYTHAGVYALVAKELWGFRLGVQNAIAAKRGRPLPRQRKALGVDEYRAGFGE